GADPSADVPSLRRVARRHWRGVCRLAHGAQHHISRFDPPCRLVVAGADRGTNRARDVFNLDAQGGGCCDCARSNGCVFARHGRLICRDAQPAGCRCRATGPPVSGGGATHGGGRMKASIVAPVLDRPTRGLEVPSRAAEKATRHTWLSDLSELVKLRLSMLVVVTTLAGFYAGWQGSLDYSLLFHALVGTALAAAGASALNQAWARECDALRGRTRERPIPAGRMSVEVALLLGVGFSLAGLLYLAFFTNLLAAMLAAITIGIYVFAYTPLKRITTLNTLVGA